jgi:hypothetical protein
MTFANDPAVLRVVGALGGDAKAARAAVRALVTVAERAAPWIDADDIRVTTRVTAFEAGALFEALVRARLVVQEERGIVLTSEGQVLGAILEAEREAEAQRKFEQREKKLGQARDIGGTSVGHCRDIDGTTPGQERDADGTLPASGRDIHGTFRDGEGVASPITRAPGARGNLPPPTPTTPATDVPPEAADIPKLMTWLHATLKHHGFTGPSRLTSTQHAEILDAIALGLSPDALEGIIRQASDNGVRKMSWLRAAIENELSDVCYRAPARAPAAGEERGPPPPGQRGATDPVPIAEWRLLRDFERREREDGGEYE